MQRAQHPARLGRARELVIDKGLGHRRRLEELARERGSGGGCRCVGCWLLDGHFLLPVAGRSPWRALAGSPLQILHAGILAATRDSSRDVKTMRKIERELMDLSKKRNSATTPEEEEEISRKIEETSKKLREIRRKMADVSTKIIIRRRGSRDSE